MRLLVCGSRHFENYELLHKELMKLYEENMVIIAGGARGADTLAERFAYEELVWIDIYPADWNLHGKAAGPIRNKQMLDEGKPDMVLAFWDGKSPGTKNMIEQATKAGIPVKVIDI